MLGKPRKTQAICYYGCYSNKVRGLRAKQVAPVDQVNTPGTEQPAASSTVSSPRLERRRWAMLIKRIYHTDPLLCPKCGGTMKIISFIEARQGDVIRKIMEHCGLWHDPPPRAPPKPGASRPVRAATAVKPQQIDPDFLVYLHREAQQ